MLIHLSGVNVGPVLTTFSICTSYSIKKKIKDTVGNRVHRICRPAAALMKLEGTLSSANEVAYTRVHCYVKCCRKRVLNEHIGRQQVHYQFKHGLGLAESASNEKRISLLRSHGLPVEVFLRKLVSVRNKKLPFMRGRRCWVRPLLRPLLRAGACADRSGRR